MERIQLKPKEARRMQRGHAWAYRNEFETLPDLPDGALVDIVSDKGRFVGRGFYQAEGGIAARILSRSESSIDAGFLRGRIRRAHELRQALYPGESVYRWLHGESDGLPGLVADRYGALVACQTRCAYYGDVAEELAAAFLEDPGVVGVRVAVKEAVFTFGEAPGCVDCSINGFQLEVDVEHGQKTGLFLDQRENWKRVEPFAKGARVFDGHCYGGLWSLHAARSGAETVLGVDTSPGAVARARQHAAKNGLSGQCTFEEGDVQEALKKSDPYDVVIIDPPSLAKSRKGARHAAGLYQALNRDAMAALRPGGFLLTACCSHFISEAAFLDLLKRAATSAQRQAAVLGLSGAAPDHPVLLSMPETAYLKCVVARMA